MSKSGTTERVNRILELQKYAKENFTTILREADVEIKQLGWVPADDDPLVNADTINQPCLMRRGMLYRRPWADFLLTLMDNRPETLLRHRGDRQVLRESRPPTTRTGAPDEEVERSRRHTLPQTDSFSLTQRRTIVPVIASHQDVNPSQKPYTSDC